MAEVESLRDVTDWDYGSHDDRPSSATPAALHRGCRGSCRRRRRSWMVERYFHSRDPQYDHSGAFDRIVHSVAAPSHVNGRLPCQHLPGGGSCVRVRRDCRPTSFSGRRDRDRQQRTCGLCRDLAQDLISTAAVERDADRARGTGAAATDRAAFRPRPMVNSRRGVRLPRCGTGDAPPGADGLSLARGERPHGRQRSGDEYDDSRIRTADPLRRRPVASSPTGGVGHLAPVSEECCWP